MASACSGTTIALMWTESKTTPRNEACWLGESELLAKFTLRPRHSKWLRKRDLWYISSASDWAKMSHSLWKRPSIHNSV